VHTNKDDLVTQPSGNSGDPIACGVVEAAGQRAPGAN
jgi:Cu/Zn superoxide dismutase